jgi:hypothetical protein
MRGASLVAPMADHRPRSSYESDKLVKSRDAPPYDDRDWGGTSRAIPATGSTIA